jgi:hypothetical protein
LAHGSGVDSVDLSTFSLLIVLALYHVEEDYLFDISKYNHEVMSEELYILNLPLISISEDDRSKVYGSPFFDVIDKNFIGIFLIEYGCKVNVLSSIVVESCCSEIDNFLVRVWYAIVLETVDLIGVGNNCTSAEVSDVGGILRIDVDFSVCEGVVLFSHQQGVLHHGGLFTIPLDTC